ncbi:hypothetical protein N2152v2_004264 [Parachlorella kessleri]
MASQHGVEPREVAFAIQPQQQYAFHLRLTPQLLESLIRSQEHAEPISIHFGDAPSENRNLQDEKDRVRARAEEAERERREKKVVSLVKQPPSQGKGTTKTHVRSLTPPPRGPTPPPRQAPKPQVTQSMLAPPPQHNLQPRPPLPPVSVAAAAAAAAGRLTPPPEAAAGAVAASGKPAAGLMKKSASSGKLGLGAKHGSSGSLAAANAGGAAVKASAAVVAVASRGDLRQTLLAVLVERPLTMQGIRAVLADVASRVKGFKVPPDKAVFERALKRVGEFRNPGKYFLHDACAEEARALMAEGAAGGAAGTAGGGKRSRESTPEGGLPPRSKAQKAGQPSAKAGPQASPIAAAGQPLSKHKRSTSQPVLGTVPAAVPAVAAPAGTAATPPVTSPASQAASPPSQQTTGNTPTATGSGDAVGGGPGPVSAVKRQRQGDAGSTHGGRSSSSRGSQDYDDTWVEAHATRQPEPAAPISSKEEYREREAAFTTKYELYFRLHQLIEANKRDFQALRDALQAAASPDERQRHQAEIDKLLRRRGDRAKRWEAAFGVLHAELAATKQRMGEFVATFQQAQQQQAQQQQAQQTKQPIPSAVSVVQ